MELGCGKADLLIRLLRRAPDATAEGFDRNPWFLADARDAAEAASVAGRLSLIETDAPAVALHGRAVDVAIAMGATGIVGEAAETLAFLGSIVVPGGEVVFGDGFWAAAPPDAALVAFGMRRDELPDGLDAFAGLGRAAGLEPVTVEAVSPGEWDVYERAYRERWPPGPWPPLGTRSARRSSALSGHGRELRRLAARRDGLRDRAVPASLTRAARRRQAVMTAT